MDSQKNAKIIQVHSVVKQSITIYLKKFIKKHSKKFGRE